MLSGIEKTGYRQERYRTPSFYRRTHLRIAGKQRLDATNIRQKAFFLHAVSGIVAGPVFIYSYFVAKNSGFMPNL